MASDNSPAARARAECRFEMTQNRARQAETAKSKYEADLQAVRNRTAQLRAIRQAKEAADREAQPPTPPPVRKRKKAAPAA